MEIVVGDGGEKLYSQNLGDFLRIKEEDHWRNVNQSTPSSSGGGGGGGRISSRLTLNAILSEKIGQSPPTDEPLRRVEPNRTLLDIIRDDQISRGRGRGDDRRNWLKDKIRLRRRGGRSAWPAAVATSSSVINNNNNHNLMMMAAATQHDSVRHNSDTDSGESTQPDSRSPAPLRNSRRSTESSVERLELMFSPQSRRLITDEVPQNENEELRTDAVEVEAVQAEVGVSAPQQPVRMSLMALLAENDRQNGFESSAFMLDEAVAEEDAENETGTSAGSGSEFNNCCVCMVRHKGAAFIPCGHTFCRLCSRELWLQRGNCPLCNNFIREILDIF